jgi:GntR family transcriptional regulator
MAGRGLHPHARVLLAAVQPAPLDVAQQLAISPGEAIAVLQRVRLADGKPIALETAHLPHRLCPGILAGHDFSTASLYSALHAEYGLHLLWATQVIGARMPDRFERDTLDLPKRTPVLSLLRVSYAAGDLPVEFVRSCYHSERYQLRTTLRDLR